MYPFETGAAWFQLTFSSAKRGSAELGRV